MITIASKTLTRERDSENNSYVALCNSDVLH